MWFDLLVVAVLLFATFRGAMKGIVWQLAVIASLVFCFFFAGTLSTALAPLIRVEPPLNRWIAMFLLYVGFSFVAFGAARVLREMIEKVKFVEYDRHLGAALGFVKGVTFSLFLAFFLVTLSETARQSILQSQSGYVAAIIMDRLHPVMPNELHNVLEPYIHQLDRPGMDLQHAHDDHDHIHDPDHPHSDLGSPPPLDPFALKSARPATPAPASRATELDDPFAAADPDSKAGGTGRGLNGGRTPILDPIEPSQASSSEFDLLRYLPAGIDGPVQREALEALKRTKPEHRQELARKLSSAGGALLRETIRQWQNGKPGTGSAATGSRTRIEEDRR